MTDVTVNVPTFDVTVEMLTPDVTVEFTQPDVTIANPTGLPGATGPMGPMGPMGPAGTINALYTGQWVWTTKTTDASGSGQVGNNVQTGWDATQLNINEEKDDGAAVVAALARIKVGDRIRVQQRTDSTKWVIYDVTGAGTDQGGWWSFPVVIETSDGVPPGNNQDVFVTHELTGEAAFVNKSGDTMTGVLTLAVDPQQPLEASTKQYSDTKWTMWKGTQAQYDALLVKDPNTLYGITG